MNVLDEIPIELIKILKMERKIFIVNRSIVCINEKIIYEVY